MGVEVDFDSDVLDKLWFYSIPWRMTEIGKIRAHETEITVAKKTKWLIEHPPSCPFASLRNVEIMAFTKTRNIICRVLLGKFLWHFVA